MRSSPFSDFFNESEPLQQLDRHRHLTLAAPTPRAEACCDVTLRRTTQILEGRVQAAHDPVDVSSNYVGGGVGVPLDARKVSDDTIAMALRRILEVRQRPLVLRVGPDPGTGEVYRPSGGPYRSKTTPICGTRGCVVRHLVNASSSAYATR